MYHNIEEIYYRYEKEKLMLEDNHVTIEIAINMPRKCETTIEMAYNSLDNMQ